MNGSAEVQRGVERFDAETRAIVARYWHRHSLPPVEDLDDEQSLMVTEYVAWLTEPIAPTGPKAELPPPLDAEPVEIPPAHPNAVFHECGPAVPGYRGKRVSRCLLPAECCPACGWSPGLPIPRIGDCARGLIRLLDYDDAVAWAEELVAVIRGAR